MTERCTALTGLSSHTQQESEPARSRTNPSEVGGIQVEWLDFMLLNTYVPANKTKAELEATNEWRDKNRGRWDHETKMFAREVYKPLVWMGDFNVGLDASDKRPRIIRHPNEANPANPRRAGNLSSVQRKFSELLAAGSGLVDAFLHLHPAVGGGPQPMDMVEPWWTCYTNQGAGVESTTRWCPRASAHASQRPPSWATRNSTRRQMEDVRWHWWASAAATTAPSCWS